MRGPLHAGHRRRPCLIFHHHLTLEDISSLGVHDNAGIHLIQVHSSAKHYLWFRSLSNTIVLST